jgi:uncharacterized membrane protein
MATSFARRLWRHFVTDHRSVRRAFPQSALKRIEDAIAAGERTHRGQVCFAVEGALHPAHLFRRLSPRERALEVFGLLRVWDTDENSGVLIYVLLADRDVEIVADRGIDRAAGAEAWRPVSALMESAFRERRYADAAVQGIEAVSALLARHFPRTRPGRNELPDQPVLL